MSIFSPEELNSITSSSNPPQDKRVTRKDNALKQVFGDNVPEKKSTPFSNFKEWYSRGGERKERVRVGVRSLGAGLYDLFKYQAPKAFQSIKLANYEKFERDPKQNMFYSTDVAVKIATKERELGRKLTNNEVDSLWDDQQKEAMSQAIEIQSSIDEIDNKWADRIDKLDLSDDKLASYTYQVGNGIGSLIMAVGVTYLTKNPQVAGTTLGFMEGATTYTEAKDKLRANNPEMSEEEIQKKSARLMVTNSAGIALLESVGLDLLFRNYAGGKLANIAIKGLITEPGQEVSQTMFSNLVAKYGYDKSVNVIDHIGNTYLTTVPIGILGGASLPTSVVQEITGDLVDKYKIDEESAKEVIEETQKVVNEQKDIFLNKEVAKSSAIQAEPIELLQEDVATLIQSRTPRSEIITQLRKETGMSDFEAKEFIAQVEQDIADDLSDIDITGIANSVRQSETITFDNQATEVPLDILNQIKENDRTRATELWQSTVSGQYAEIEQRISELEDLADNTTDEAELSGINKDISVAENELQTLTDDFIGRLSGTQAEVTDEAMVNELNKITESPDTKERYNKTYRPKMAKQIEDFAGSFAERKSQIENRIGEIEAIEKKTPEQRSELKALKQELKVIENEISAKTERVQEETDQAFVEDTRQRARVKAIQESKKEKKPKLNTKKITTLEERVNEVFNKKNEELKKSSLSIDEIIAVEAENYMSNLEFDGELFGKTGEEIQAIRDSYISKLNADNTFFEQHQIELSPADQALRHILLTMELAEPGARIRNEDGSWTAKTSTFPQWLPEGLRRRALFDKLLKNVGSMETLKYPTDPRQKNIRLLVHEIYNQLDQALNVDTSEIRNSILQEYENKSEEVTLDERIKGSESKNAEGINYEAKDVTDPNVRYQRLAISSAIPQYSRISNDEVVQIFRRFIPDNQFGIAFVENIGTPEHGLAWGATYKDMVQFVNNPLEETPTHEAVHAFLRAYIPKDQHERYVTSAYRNALDNAETVQDFDRIQKGVDDIVTLYGGKLSRKSAEKIYGEELLAEGFVDYVKGRDTNPPSLIRQLYDAVIDMLRRIFNSDSADRLYDDMYYGRIRHYNEQMKEQVMFQEQVNKHYADTTKTLERLKNEVKKDYISMETIMGMLNRNDVKKHDKELILRSINEIGGEGEINRQELIDTISKNLMAVTVINSTDYANYGYSNLVDFTNSGKTSFSEEVIAETHVYDTPFKHGEVGHFSGTYNRKFDPTSLSIRHIVGEQEGNAVNKWAVINNEIELVTEEDAQRAVIWLGETEAEAQQFLNDLKDKKDRPETKSGLLGHTRVATIKTKDVKIKNATRELLKVKANIPSYQREKSLIKDLLSDLSNPDFQKNIVNEMKKEDGISLLPTYLSSIYPEIKKNNINRIATAISVNSSDTGTPEAKVDFEAFSINTEKFFDDIDNTIMIAQQTIERMEEDIQDLHKIEESENNMYAKYIMELQADPLQGGSSEVITPYIKAKEKFDDASRLMSIVEGKSFVKGEYFNSTVEDYQDIKSALSEIAKKNGYTDVALKYENDKAIIDFETTNKISDKENPDAYKDFKAFADKLLTQTQLEVEKNQPTQLEKDFFNLGSNFEEYAIRKELQLTTNEMIEAGVNFGYLRLPTALTLSLMEGHVPSSNLWKVTENGFIKNKTAQYKPTKDLDLIGSFITVPKDESIMEQLDWDGLNPLVKIGEDVYELTTDQVEDETIYGELRSPEGLEQPYEYTGDNQEIEVGEEILVNGETYTVVKSDSDSIKAFKNENMQSGYLSDYIEGIISDRESNVVLDFRQIIEKDVTYKQLYDWHNNSTDVNLAIRFDDDTIRVLEDFVEEQIDGNAENINDLVTMEELENHLEGFLSDWRQSEYEFHRRAEDFGFEDMEWEDKYSDSFYYGVTDMADVYEADQPQTYSRIMYEGTREEFGFADKIYTKQEEETKTYIGGGFDKNGEYIFDENILSKSGQTVHKYYKQQVSKAFKKVFKNAEIFTDERGLQFYQAPISPRDTGDVPMYMPMSSEFQKQNETPTIRTEDLKPIELPELVEISQELMGKVPELSGRFKTKLGAFYYKEGQNPIAIRLRKDLKPHKMVKVLAHEIGHLIDFLPTQTIKRGNLVGRLATLNKFYKDSFAGVLPRNKELREELIGLTETWTPYDKKYAPISYIKYRNSSPELYAEFVSVLLNDPAYAKQLAPKFFDAFFEKLDAKPEVKKAYFEIQDLLNKERAVLIGNTRSNVQEMFLNAEQKARDIELIRQQMAKEKTKNFWSRLKFEMISNIEPFRERITRLKKQGIEVSDAENPVYALEERNYLGGRIKAFLQTNINPIYSQLQTMGISWETFGEKLAYDRIADGDRMELANFKGITKERAQESLDNMRQQIGNLDYQKMDKLADDFRKSMKSLTKESFDLGLIPEDVYNNIKDNNKYVTFKVVDYMEDNVNSKIFQQVGSFKDIQNPATSTVLKMLATIHTNEYQLAKGKAVNFLKENFSDEIREADTRWDGKRQTYVPPKDPNLDIVYISEEGKLKAYYVDKFIGKSLKGERLETTYAVMEVFKMLNTKLFRPLFIKYNPGFQAFNFVRDFMRFWKNTPDINVFKAMKLYYKARDVAKLRAFGIPEGKLTKRQQEALDTLIYLEGEKVLSITYNTFAGVESTEDDYKQIEAILKQYGFGEVKGEKAKGVGGFIVNTLNTIANVGDFIETLPKVAGYYHLQDQEGKLTEEQQSFIRRRIGSPDFFDGGYFKPVTNEIFLFSNSITQGWRTDIESMGLDPKTRSGYWWKTAQATFLPKVLMFGIALGLGGDDLEKIMRGASEYDKSNYTIVPLGMDENGKPVYLRLPQDEMGRFLGAIFWKIMTIGQNDQAVGKSLTDIFSFFGGQLPSVSPAITNLSATYQYYSGQNPYDAFRGRNVISDEAFTAGGKYKAKEFYGWLFNQMGGGLFYRFNTSSTPRKKSNIEKAFQLPLLSNIGGRFVRVSDYGYYEEASIPLQQAQQEEARARIERNKIVAEYVQMAFDKGVLSDQQIEDEVSVMLIDYFGYNPLDSKYSRTSDETVKTDKAEARKLRDKFESYYLRGGGSENPVISRLEGAGSNNQKTAVLEAQKEKLTPTEYANLLEFALEMGSISQDLYDQLTQK